MRRFFRDVIGVKLSKGYLAKLLNRISVWTWVFRAEMFTLFKISPSRSSDVLLEMLGTEFNGLLGCDYFSAYRKYMRLNEKVQVQFCLAHLIRDIKFLVMWPNKLSASWPFNGASPKALAERPANSGPKESGPSWPLASNAASPHSTT
jgi:hypothetical protein